MEGLAREAHGRRGHPRYSQRRLCIRVKGRRFRLFVRIHNLGITIRVSFLLIRRRLWCPGLMVVLIANHSQDPSAKRLSIDGFGPPGAVGLLGRRLELGRGALVGLAPTVAYQVAANDLAPLLVVSGDLVPVRARLDDLVAVLLHRRLEILEEVVKGGKCLAGAYVDRPQDAEHGGGRDARVCVRDSADGSMKWSGDERLGAQSYRCSTRSTATRQASDPSS